MRHTPTYRSWLKMRERCHNPAHDKYPYYGGRGIVVCDRWRDDFRAFYADMGERPEGRTLDRIDLDGHYTPENCRWATRQEQNRNKSNTVLVDHNGEMISTSEFARIYGVGQTSLSQRIRAGQNALEAAEYLQRLSRGEIQREYRIAARRGSCPKYTP